jgi:glycerol-3-phosphate dehydrogenase
MLGACAAWDASLRGLSVVLLEAGDFGQGASANSLKIVHGGLRYLQHLDLRRFRESVGERSFWLRAAPHLVDPLPVVFPTYGWGLKSRPVARAGLLLNDLLSTGRNRGIERGHGIPGGRSLTRTQLLERVPELVHDPPDGGVLFHDALFRFPERLVLEVILAAADAGALPLNHVRVVGAEAVGDGRIEIQARDTVSASSVEVVARAVINATGGHADHVAGALLGTPRESAPGWSTAVNLVVDHMGHDAAFALRVQGEGEGERQLFVVPWNGRTMIGTGHYNLPAGPPVDGRGEEEVREDDTRRFLGEVNRAWPGGGTFERSDVRLVHWGVLPRLEGPVEGPVRLLRRHRVVDHSDDGMPGVFTLLGVKLTTGRRAAAEAVDHACRRLGRGGGSGATRDARLPGAPPVPLARLEREVLERAGGRLPRDVARALARDYGARAFEVIALLDEDPRLAELVVPGEPVIRAQFVYGVRAELARTPEDLVARRTCLGPRGAQVERSEPWLDALLAGKLQE